MKVFTNQLIAISLLLCSSISAQAQTTYYVDAAQPDNTGAGNSWANAYRDVQVAINAAASGDQIWVKNGTYKPTHDPFGSTAPTDDRDKTFFLKDGVAIYGGFAGTETSLAARTTGTPSILSGDFSSDDAGFTNNGENAYHVVVSVGATNTTVFDGFTVQGGNANGNSTIFISGNPVQNYNGGGMYNQNSSPMIANTVFSTNSTIAQGGGMYNNTSSPTITNTVFSNNESDQGGGMYNNQSSPTITNIVFSNNAASYRAGGGG